MKSKKIYCVYCGKKNNIVDLKCKSCKKKLDPKENMLFEYIKDHIKDDFKSNIGNKTIDIIKKFIINHLYGSILTATLIFTLVSAIVAPKGDDIEKVTTKPSILINNINKCVIANSKEIINVCSEGYVLDGDICKKEEQVNATATNVCPNGYYASGNTCISKTNYNMLTRKECIAPVGDNVVGTHIENGQCFVNYCAGWTDGECSAGSMEPIDFTVTSYCPNGTNLVNGVCKMLANYNIEYSCSEGTLNGDKCMTIREEESKIGCEDGYILNEECNLCVLGE